MDKELTPIPDTQEISDQTPEQSMKIIGNLFPDRRKKVLNIREQLVNGTYDVKGKINDLHFRKV